MLRGVPQEMHSLLLNKKTVKEAWEAIKTMRLEQTSWNFGDSGRKVSPTRGW